MMSPIQVLLSDRIHELVVGEAAAQGVEPSQICGKIIADHYDTRAASKTHKKRLHRPAGENDLRQRDSSFRVEEAFPAYPPQSLRLAQAFIDEVAKLSGAEVRQRNRSISFMPRFVRIDYVLSGRSPVPGLVASFYGSGDQFDDPRGLLKSGAKSYVTARITSAAELDYCRPFIARAYENRFGPPQP